jgi:hypothetical protein
MSMTRPMATRPALPKLCLHRETVRRLTEQGSRACSGPISDEPVESRYNLCQLTREC